MCGRGDHVGAGGEMRRGHLVGCAAYVQSSAGDALLIEGGCERRLVDEVAAREVDEERVGAHEPQLRRADQVLGLLGGHRQRQHEIGALQQLVELHLLDLAMLDHDVRVAHQHLHAERQRQLADAAAEGTVADDAGRRAVRAAGPGRPAAPGRPCRRCRRARCRARRRSSGRSPARSPPPPSCGSPAWSSTPCAEALATAMLRMSTATRETGDEVRQRGEQRAPRTPSPGRRR